MCMCVCMYGYACVCMDMFPGTAYLDHAGAGVYSASQVAAVSQSLLTNVYSNPHSASSEVDGGPGCRYIQSARERILQLFGTSEEHYCVVFTVRGGGMGRVRVRGSGSGSRETVSVIVRVRVVVCAGGVLRIPVAPLTSRARPLGLLIPPPPTPDPRPTPPLP